MPVVAESEPSILWTRAVDLAGAVATPIIARFPGKEAAPV